MLAYLDNVIVVGKDVDEIVQLLGKVLGQFAREAKKRSPEATS